MTTELTMNYFQRDWLHDGDKRFQRLKVAAEVGTLL